MAGEKIDVLMIGPMMPLIVGENPLMNEHAAPFLTLTQTRTEPSVLSQPLVFGPELQPHQL